MCRVDLEPIPNDVKGPVYVYYQLDNFYQNHRRYVKSRDSSQLNGNYLLPDKLGDCDPIIKVEHLWEHQKYPVANKAKKLDDSAPATPCGLVAKSMFNDTFELWGPKGNITIDITGIAWSSDKMYKFKNVEADGKPW